MNVNLWFARNQENEIVGILNSDNKGVYHCPICNSEVIPKALESKRVTPHFAHIDKSKCDSESMIHWWMKHKFIDKGDVFSIVTDKEITYKCAYYDTEVTFNLESGIYRPDLVVYTECGSTVIFEMANTNKKQVKDYIDRWIELDKVIVEVDIKALTNSMNDNKKFNALYYKGKCFNFNKRDGGYYNTIGKLKEEMKVNGKYDIELVKKLDWFWEEIVKYESNTDKDIDLSEIFIILESIDVSSYKLIRNSLKNRKSKVIISKFESKLKEKEYLKIKKRMDIFKEKHLSLDYINDILMSNTNSEYYVGEILTDRDKFKFKILDRNKSFKFYLDFKIYDFTGKDVEKRMKNLHNRIAYQEVKSGIHDNLVKLQNEFKGFKFNMDYIQYDREGFYVEATNRIGRLNEFSYSKYYAYNSMYCKKEELLNYDLLKETICLHIERYKSNEKCKDCGNSFSMKMQEISFFIDNKLKLPKRCKPCRKNRKKNKLEG